LFCIIFALEQIDRPYLQASKREALADYSLPVAVVVLTLIGSYVFKDVERKDFSSFWRFTL